MFFITSVISVVLSQHSPTAIDVFTICFVTPAAAYALLFTTLLHTYIQLGYLLLIYCCLIVVQINYFVIVLNFVPYFFAFLLEVCQQWYWISLFLLIFYMMSIKLV